MINNAFVNNECDAFMHNYMRCARSISANDIIKLMDQIQITGKIYKKFDRYGPGFLDAKDDNNTSVPVQNGHLSLKRHVFDNLRVPENAIGYEDSQYSKNILDANYKIVFTADMLAVYRCY